MNNVLDAIVEMTNEKDDIDKRIRELRNDARELRMRALDYIVDNRMFDFIRVDYGRIRRAHMK